MVFVRSYEVKEIFADGVVDGMLFQEEEIGPVFFCLVSHHLTELAKMLPIFLVKTRVYFLEGLGEVKVVDGNLRLEFDKITLTERMCRFEIVPLMDIISHLYLEMRLQSLKQPACVDILVFILPEGYLEMGTAVVVQTTPEMKGML